MAVAVCSKKKHVIYFVLMLMALASCERTAFECYDKQLYELHKNDFCTADCPGVMGCDNKQYCNECEANKQGVSIK